MLIRNENAGEEAAIAGLITAAFATAAHAAGTEAAIVAALRAAGALDLSLVAEDGGAPAGHLGASGAMVAGAGGWACIAPVSVRPDRQGQGVGTALMTEALARLRAAGWKGAVLVGDPGYYTRFGFTARPGLSAAGIPGEYVLGLGFTAEPVGEIRFHPAFS